VLLAVPNFSEGRDAARIERISTGFATGAALLDTHSDPLHNRTVLTLSGPEGSLASALVRGAGACAKEIDIWRHEGAHPCIGALDVCPVVWLTEGDRDAARGEALDAARRVGTEHRVPVFLYGELATHQSHRERAFFRSGGLTELRRRLGAGELRPDFGPAEPHPTAGATLVTARPPLAAFNVELSGATPDHARELAARLREAGGGPTGVRAIAVQRDGDRVQVATNVHDPIAVPLGEVVARVRELAEPRGARVIGAEIVGLVPAAALEGWPAEVPLDFDPTTQTIERRVQS
jgi:glutamate formiminotransferase / 5-formyltetrahydrofolate cyclo-ligase